MSIDDYGEGVSQMARQALAEASAIKFCSRHDVVIRVGNDGAERRAYAFATNALKSNEEYWKREDVMAEIKNQLGWAADGECPQCAYERDH